MGARAGRHRPQGVQSVGLTGITGLGGCCPADRDPGAVASRPMPSGYSLDRAR